MSGSAITFNNDTASYKFSGGIAAETPTFTNHGAGQSDLSGTWRITAATWTPPSGCRINSGDSVTVEGTLLNSANISINAGGVLTAAACEDGINVSGTHQPELRFSNNSTLYSRNGVLTLHSVRRPYSIAGGQNVTFDTTKYGTADVPTTFNIDGIIKVNRTDGYTGGMIVKGCGKVVFNSASTFVGGLTVTNTATVAVNVKLTADVSMNGGTFALTSGMDFTGKTVNIIDKPKWVKSVQIVNGDIVATIKSAATVIYVR